MASDQTIWASVFVRERIHGQDDRRLFEQSLATHLHEAQPSAGFFIFAKRIAP